MTDLEALKATPPSGFRFGIFANSVDVTHVATGTRLGSFPTAELAEAFLYALIDYRGAVPVKRCEFDCEHCKPRGWWNT